MCCALGQDTLLSQYLSSCRRLKSAGEFISGSNPAINKLPIPLPENVPKIA